MFPKCTFPILIFVLFFMPYCASGTEVGDRVFIAGIPQDFPPHFFIDEELGKPAGFGVDVMDAVAQRSNITVEYKVFENWEQTNQAARVGLIDIIPNMGFTSERKSFMDFTPPYETFRINYYIRSQSVIKSVADIKPGQMGVVITNKARFLLEEKGWKNLQTTHSSEDLVWKLIAGDVDCIAMPEPVMNFLIKKSKLENHVEVLGEPLVEIKRGIAISKGREELLHLIRSSMKDFILSKQFKEIYTDWYGQPEPYWTAKRVGISSLSLFLVLLLTGFSCKYRFMARMNKELEKTVLDRTNKIEENERRFRILFEKAPLPYQSLDENGNFIEVNRKWLELLGYDREEVIGKSFAEFLHPDWIDHFKENFPRFKSIGEVLGVEFEFKKKDDTFIWIKFDGKIGKDVEGNFLQTHCVFRDITKQRNLEKSLNESSKLNELMLNSLPHPAMLINHERKVLAANKIAVEQGVEIGEFCWDTFGHRDCISKEHKKRIMENPNCAKDDILCTFCLADDLMKSGKAQNNREVSAFGRLFDVWWVPVDENTFLHYAIDITERKYAEEQVRKEAERSKILLEIYLKAPKLSDKELFKFALDKTIELTGSTIGFFHEVSDDQKFVMLNTWNSETLQSCNAEHGAHYLIENAGNWVDCIHAQKPIVYNNFALSPNQKGLPPGHVPVERFMSVPVKEEGKVRYVFGVGNKSVDYDDNDMTQIQLVANELYRIIRQRIADKELDNLQAQLVQAQKMESIGTLAGGIAHDFNNILTGIIGFTQLALADTEKGSNIQDNLLEVYAAGKRAGELVRQILAFARQSDEEIMLVQIDGVLEEALKFIRSSIPTSIEIRKHISSSSPILGNKTELYQVIMNLCTNAAQAMEENGGILDVQLQDITLEKAPAESLDLQQGDYIRMSIADSGKGIAPEIIDKIFVPYFTTKGSSEGTGLGLALVHGIVESYKGKIVVDSIPDKGSTFTLYFPIARKSLPQHRYEPQEVPHGIERILFVDDEAALVKMGSRILESLGYNVTARTSSVEALKLLKAKPNDFDLVISDITMPNMTGDRLAMELRKIDPEIPIILCTGYSQNITEEKAKEIGVNALMLKPFVRKDLAVTVRKVLGKESV